MCAASRSGQPPTLSKQPRTANGRLLGGLTVLAAAVGLAAGRHRRPRASFEDQVVVITGGSRGLGLALARRLASERARLYLIARSGDQLDRVLPDLVARGARTAHAIVCDVRRPDQVAHAIGRIGSTEHRIDVLVNNAGVIQSVPFEHATTADFEDAMDTHFWGALWLVRAVVPWMRQQGGGRIVNITSIGGRIGVPHMAPYCASKFALVGLSETLHAELAKDRILVTTVCPNLMRTGSYRNVTVRGQHDREAAWFAIAASAPGLTTSADRAAALILDACRRGRAHVTPGWPARTAEVLSAVAPERFAGVMTAFARMLLPAPGAGASAGDLQRSLRLDLGWLERVLPRGAAADLNQPEPVPR